MRGGNGSLGVNVHDLVVDVTVEHVWNEIAPDALDLVRPRLTGGEQRRLRRFDGHDLELRLKLLQHLSDAGDGASGADAPNENVDLAIGVLPKLDGSRPPVNFRVGRVLELLRHPGVRRL